MRTTKQLIILGAGLTGLTLAYLLRDAPLDVRILEARDRPGGRIRTLQSADGPGLDMGATWLGQQHVQLRNLLRELELDTYPQYQNGRLRYEAAPGAAATLHALPPDSSPSYRIAGGSTALIERLISCLPEQTITYGTAVTSITARDRGIEVATEGQTYTADHVVSTLPPALLAATVSLQPALPAAYRTLAAASDTWMGRSIKVALVYDTPFWREGREAATFFSNVGPVSELHDHSDPVGGGYALKGFLDPATAALAPAERERRVVAQLVRAYGPAATTYRAYHDTVWRDEPFTLRSTAPDPTPHRHAGEALLRGSHWNGRLLLAGAESSDAYPGYMEGAVRSARLTAARLR
ncbi:hypothetical protein LEM8419_02616 [Neolewinella maritima]|uniref:Amine oxidase domain-containing protein n=1 Tax=Neolewinella maritima TaxID=1383882 RepID=A0ABM9B2Z4_9BACT|nr:NAD(P)/FAD-dependent oxidoreductase [Neolewinella maritima]CAH1001710.1 hypothetical protein LEM8419_02616 [Neolewinella maritima]